MNDSEVKPWELIIWFIAIAGAVLSCLWIYDTFTVKSYEYGENVQVSSNLEFIIQSPTLTLYMDGSISNRFFSEKEYTSVYQLSDFDADSNNYYFELNNSRFYTVEMTAGNIQCVLNFTFLDTLGQDVLTDELVITINFYSDSTIVLVESFGGYEASTYWQSYFNSNGFDLRVYQIME